MLIAAQLTIAKSQKCPIYQSFDKWIKGMYLYTVEYYFAMKNDKFESCIIKWMHIETIILNEIRQSLNIIWFFLEKFKICIKNKIQYRL